MFSIYLKYDSFDKAEICILSIGLGHVCVLVLFMFALMKNDNHQMKVQSLFNGHKNEWSKCSYQCTITAYGHTSVSV